MTPGDNPRHPTNDPTTFILIAAAGLGAASVSGLAASAWALRPPPPAIANCRRPPAACPTPWWKRTRHTGWSASARATACKPRRVLNLLRVSRGCPGWSTISCWSSAVPPPAHDRPVHHQLARRRRRMDPSASRPLLLGPGHAFRDKPNADHLVLNDVAHGHRRMAPAHRSEPDLRWAPSGTPWGRGSCCLMAAG